MEHTNPGLSFVCLESRYDPLRGALEAPSWSTRTRVSLSFVSNLDMTPCGASGGRGAARPRPNLATGRQGAKNPPITNFFSTVSTCGPSSVRSFFSSVTG